MPSCSTSLNELSCSRTLQIRDWCRVSDLRFNGLGVQVVGFVLASVSVVSCSGFGVRGVTCRSKAIGESIRLLGVARGLLQTLQSRFDPSLFYVARKPQTLKLQTLVSQSLKTLNPKLYADAADLNG